MTDIAIIRELHCYKKMYSCLWKIVTECIEECQDVRVRVKLIKAQQDAEDIYTGEIYEAKDLTADERIIVALLGYIADSEIDRVVDTDFGIVDACVDWSLTLQDRKNRLTDEFIEEQVKKILTEVNKKEDSEQ